MYWRVKLALCFAFVGAELAFLRSWNGLGDTPAPKLDVRREIEKPILRRPHEPNDIAGYIDVVLYVRELRLSAGIAPSDDYGRPYLGVDAKTYADWNARWTDFRSFAFDAKNAIRSLGELTSIAIERANCCQRRGQNCPRSCARGLFSTSDRETIGGVG